jgi:hypothetical protein
MRYNPPPSKAENEARAQAYVGRTVKDTKGRWGVVQSAWVTTGSRVVTMSVSLANTEDVFFTDSEHATIVRTPTDESE